MSEILKDEMALVRELLEASENGIIEITPNAFSTNTWILLKSNPSEKQINDFMSHLANTYGIYSHLEIKMEGDLYECISLDLPYMKVTEIFYIIEKERSMNNYYSNQIRSIKEEFIRCNAIKDELAKCDTSDIVKLSNE